MATIERLADLLIDLDRAGIRELVRDGNTLRFRPRSAVTADLAGRLKAHKPALLAILRPAGAPDGAITTSAAGKGEPAKSRPGAAPEGLRWEDCLDPPDQCPKCGTLELWQTLAGNWRCLRCDPPTTARRLAELAGRIRRQKSRRNTTGQKGQYSV